MFGLLQALVRFSMLRWLARLALIVGVGLLAWQAWLQSDLARSGLPVERQAVAQAAVLALTDDIARKRGGVQRVVLPAIPGDHAHFFAQRLEEQLERRGVLAIALPPLLDRARQWLWGANSRELTAPQAGRLAVEAGADAALIARIDIFELSGQSGRIQGSWRLIDRAGNVLQQASFERANNIRPPDFPAARTPFFGIAAPTMPDIDLSGWLIWAVLATLLPLVTLGALRGAANHDSNGMRVVVLALYSLFSTGMAVAIVGLDLASRWGLAGALLVLLGTLIYHLWIMSGMIEPRRTDPR